VFAQSESLTIL